MKRIGFGAQVERRECSRFAEQVFRLRVDGKLAVGGWCGDPGEILGYAAIAPTLDTFAAACRLDRGEQKVDLGRHNNAAFFEETLLCIGEQGEDAVVEAEVADVITENDIDAFGQIELIGIRWKNSTTARRSRFRRQSGAQPR